MVYLIYLKVALKKWKHGWQGCFLSIKSDHYLYSRYRWKHLRSLLHIRYVLDISKLNGPLPLSFRFLQTPHWPLFFHMLFYTVLYNREKERTGYKGKIIFTKRCGWTGYRWNNYVRSAFAHSAHSCLVSKAA